MRRMEKSDFELFRSSQYCDNPACSDHGLVGAGNIQTKSLLKGQGYCKRCKTVFSIRKGTVFFGLRTNMDKIVRCLSLLASGMGVNAVGREQDVTTDSLRDWILLAAGHVNGLTAHMQQNMHLEQVQIDEFWSFIRKKKNI